MGDKNFCTVARFYTTDRTITHQLAQRGQQANNIPHFEFKLLNEFYGWYFQFLQLRTDLTSALHKNFMTNPF